MGTRRRSSRAARVCRSTMGTRSQSARPLSADLETAVSSVRGCPRQSRTALNLASAAIRDYAGTQPSMRLQTPMGEVMKMSSLAARLPRAGIEKV